MKKLLVIVMLLAMSLGSIGTAFADTATPEVDLDSIEDFRDFPGIVSAYGRAWVGEEPQPEGDYPRQLLAAELMFESDEDAARVYKSLAEVGLGEDSTTDEVDELGDAAAVHQLDEYKVPYPITLVLVVLDGDSVLLIMSNSDDVDLDRTVAIAEHVLGTEAHSDEVELSADGSSTGGIYDRYPAEDNDLLEGYSTAADIDLMEAPGA